MLTLYLVSLHDAEDKNTFADFYKAHRGLMYQAAMKVLGKRQLAEDAVHNAFLSVLGQTARLREMGEGQKTGFAAVIARNKAIDLLRKEGRTEHLEDLEEDALLTEFEIDDSDRLFRRLPSQYADVLKLLGLGFKPSDIAQLTQREIGTVYKQLDRGKKLLGEVLEKEGYQWPVR